MGIDRNGRTSSATNAPTARARSPGACANRHSITFALTADMAIILALVAAGLMARSAAAAPLDFLGQVVASQQSGDCKAIADFDGDGLNDLAIGGSALFWYRSPDWTARLIATANDQFTTDMEAADVDGDGDADLVVPDGTAGVYWWENGSAGQTWTRHLIGAAGGMYTHDVAAGDIDGDGDLDVVGRPLNGNLYIYRHDGAAWTARSLATTGGEGLDLVDLNADGRLDLVASGQWHQAPAGDIITTAWSTWIFDSGRLGQSLKIEAADLNADGRPDIVLTPAEGTGDIAWYRAPANPQTGAWTRTVLLAGADHYHSLALVDLNGDGWRDIVTAQMHIAVTGPVIAVYLNAGAATSFTRQVLAGTSSHNLVVGDLDGDGRPDLAGCNFIGTPPVSAWMNQATYVSATGPIVSSLSLTAFPNPFNANVRLTIEGPLAGPTSARVYDLKGRFVYELAADDGVALPRTLTWDGRDHAGAAQASGIYYVVLKVGSEWRAQSVVMVK